MNKWKGPWKCEKCIWQGMVQIEHYRYDGVKCDGKFIPYDRRRVTDEIVEEMMNDLMRAAKRGYNFSSLVCYRKAKEKP